MKYYILITIATLVLLAGCAQPYIDITDDLDLEELPVDKTEEVIGEVSDDFIGEDDVELEEII